MSYKYLKSSGDKADLYSLLWIEGLKSRLVSGCAPNKINIVHYNRYMKNYATLITSAQYVLYSYDLCIVKTGVVNA